MELAVVTETDGLFRPQRHTRLSPEHRFSPHTSAVIPRNKDGETQTKHISLGMLQSQVSWFANTLASSYEMLVLRYGRLTRAIDTWATSLNDCFGFAFDRYSRPSLFRAPHQALRPVEICHFYSSFAESQMTCHSWFMVKGLANYV